MPRARLVSLTLFPIAAAALAALFLLAILALAPGVLAQSTTDYDTDNDHLIEVKNLA